MAQSAEHILGKDEVPGSNPVLAPDRKPSSHLFVTRVFFMFKES